MVRTFSFLIVLSIILSGLSVNLPVRAADETYNSILSGLKNTGVNAGYEIKDEKGTPKREFVEGWSRYINGLLMIMGALFFVLVLFAGYLWMTAKGNEDQVDRARKMIIGAAIGLLFIIGGRIIAELVFTILGNSIATK